MGFNKEYWCKHRPDYLPYLGLPLDTYLSNHNPFDPNVVVDVKTNFSSVMGKYPAYEYDYKYKTTNDKERTHWRDVITIVDHYVYSLHFTALSEEDFEKWIIKSI
jgi:hypothetical protein